MPSYERSMEILSQIHCRDWNFQSMPGVFMGFLFRVFYKEPDTLTNKEEIQYGRWWYVGYTDTESQLVQTALKACLTSAEHRVREGFKYKNKAIYMPHFDVNTLLEWMK